jgi:hypothetical protein
MVKSMLAVLATLAVSGASASAAPAGPPIPRNVITAAMKKADCSLPLKDALEGIDVSTLDAALKLVEVPCWRAAYQAGSILFVLDPKAPAKARLLSFQHWNGKTIGPTLNLTMPSFEEATKTLASFNKGRGLGDCGTIGEWHWEGTDFKLTGVWVKNDCDGEPFDEADDKDKEKWRIYPPKQ